MIIKSSDWILAELLRIDNAGNIGLKPRRRPRADRMLIMDALLHSDRKQTWTA